MNKFLYFFIGLISSINYCLAGGHNASAGLRFCNSLDTQVVQLRSGESTEIEFEEKNVEAKKCICWEARFDNYEEVNTPEEANVILNINVLVENKKIGEIALIRSISPDPIFVYKTEKNVDFKLRIKRSRFGGGPGSIEIVKQNF